MSTTLDETRCVSDLSSLQAGICLPGPIYDARHPTLLLLQSGVVLTSSALRLLHERGVREISVTPDVYSRLFGGAAADRVVQSSERTWPQLSQAIEAQRVLQRRWRERIEFSLEAIEAQRRAVISQLGSVVDDSLKVIERGADVMIAVCLEQEDSESIAEHVLRAAQLALCVGAKLELSNAELGSTALGVMLSRLGQNEATRQVSGKEKVLTSVERLEMHKVPRRTFEMLQSMADLPPTVRIVASQLFERLDGSGYPRNRQGAQIHPLAKLAAVCDVCAALTCLRPHRPAFAPHAALRHLLQQGQAGKYDLQCVKQLLQTVTAYPVGSLVELSDGQLARVVRGSASAIDRPIVQLVLDDASSHDSSTAVGQATYGMHLDLSQQTEVTIVGLATLLN